MRLSKYNVTLNTDDGLILANLVSGGVAKLNADYRTRYLAYETGERDGDSFERELAEGGFVVRDNEDELAKLIVQSRAERFSSECLALTIAPTMGCNFRCPYCYEKGIRAVTMSASVEDGIAAFIEDRKQELTSLDVTWYGGEPLLAMSVIRSLTGKMRASIRKDTFYSASIVTNGYLLTHDIAQELNGLGVNSAQVTLDGSKHDHDARRVPADGTPTYDEILNNVAVCAEAIDITVRVNVDKHNIAAAEELLDRFEENGLKNRVRFYLAAVDDINKTCTADLSCMGVEEFSSREIAFYAHAIERGFAVELMPPQNIGICCAVSTHAFVIDPIGNLYKCWDEIGRNERSVGNVCNPLSLNKNAVRWLSYEPSDAECRDCFAFPVCMGGCPNHSLHSGKKECASIRYNIMQRLAFLERSEKLKQTVSHV